MIFRHTLFALVAVAVIVICVPFIPSSVLIQLRGLTVADGHYTLDRTVTIPSDASMLYEVGNRYTSLPECNRLEPLIHYERRDTPITVPLICDPSEGDWVMRYCVEVRGVFGITFAPTCIEAGFTVGPTSVEKMIMQQGLMNKKIMELQEQINLSKEN
jgi:hypothetical protein